MQLLTQRSSDPLGCTERKIAQLKPSQSEVNDLLCHFFSFVCLFYVDTNGRAAYGRQKKAVEIFLPSYYHQSMSSIPGSLFIFKTV